MKSTLLALFLTLLTSNAQAAEVRQAGTLSVTRCQSNGNMFAEDKCVRENVDGAGRSCSVLSDGQSVKITTNLWTRTGGFDTPYEQSSKGNRYHLTGLSGLVRGSAIMNGGSLGAKSVEIYENMDRSGKEYVRYQCVLAPVKKIATSAPNSAKTKKKAPKKVYEPQESHDSGGGSSAR